MPDLANLSPADARELLTRTYVAGRLVGGLHKQADAAQFQQWLKDLWADPQSRQLLINTGVGAGVGGLGGAALAAGSPRRRSPLFSGLHGALAGAGLGAAGTLGWRAIQDAKGDAAANLQAAEAGNQASRGAFGMVRDAVNPDDRINNPVAPAPSTSGAPPSRIANTGREAVQELASHPVASVGMAAGGAALGRHRGNRQLADAWRAGLNEPPPLARNLLASGKAEAVLGMGPNYQGQNRALGGLGRILNQGYGQQTRLEGNRILQLMQSREWGPAASSILTKGGLKTPGKFLGHTPGRLGGGLAGLALSLLPALLRNPAPATATAPQ